MGCGDQAGALGTRALLPSGPTSASMRKTKRLPSEKPIRFSLNYSRTGALLPPMFSNMSTGTIHHTSGCGTGFWRTRRRGSQGTFPSVEENQFKAVRHNQVTNLWYGQQRGVTGRTTTRSPWGGGSLNRPWRRGRSTGWVRTPPVPGGST